MNESTNIQAKRRDIWWCELTGVGSEQYGKRPVLVINVVEDIAIVAPFTTKVKRNLPTHAVYRIKRLNNQVSVLLLEQPVRVDRSRLTKKIEELTIEDWHNMKINQKFKISLGLELNEELQPDAVISEITESKDDFLTNNQNELIATFDENQLNKYDKLFWEGYFLLIGEYEAVTDSNLFIDMVIRLTVENRSWDDVNLKGWVRQL